jgi:predicted nucleic acid-binding protein
MIVVSDTTAITTLLKAGEERLLLQLFDAVTIPQAVWDELHAFHSRLPDCVKLRQVTDPSQRLPGTETLGRGEAEAIKLAREIRGDLFLTDDRRARVAATRLGISSAGLLALLVQAKQKGRISSVRNLIGRLEAKGGLYLSDSAKAEALKSAGE